jgi:hypothetical protein
MGEHNSVCLSLMKRHTAKWTVNDNEPIAIGLRVEPAKDVSPRELALTAKIGSDDSLVKCTPLGIVRRGGIVKGMKMTQKHCLDAVLYANGCLDGEPSEARRMLAKAMLTPARDWQRARGNWRRGL